MVITLDHTILDVRDPKTTADFLVDVLDLPSWTRLAHFTAVRIGDTTLDLVEAVGHIEPRHFAFRVSKHGFERILVRLGAHGLPFWADPFCRNLGKVNAWDDSFGAYFKDPNGHLLEILTRSYTSVGLRPRAPKEALNNATD